MVLRVTRGGPAWGTLARGDYITHIDGVSVLTSDGARRLAEVEPGDDVDLTIRRDGRTLKVSVHAAEPANVYVTAPPSGGYSITWDSPPTPAVAPVAPGAPGVAVAPRVWVGATPSVPPAPGAAGVTPAVPVAPVAPAIPASPSGWFGFSIRCNSCGWTTRSSDDAPVWQSDEVPELSRVSPESPAGRAGFQAGDRITHIDGVSILSRDGGRRFGAVRPGQRVRLRVQRGSTTLTRELTLGTRPEVRAAIAASAPRTPAPPSMRRELRYTGQLDNVSVEIWSAGGPTVEKIGDTMVITVGGSVVRIKVDPKR
jgi:S1-C subfamily serine protease